MRLHPRSPSRSAPSSMRHLASFVLMSVIGFACGRTVLDPPGGNSTNLQPGGSTPIDSTLGGNAGAGSKDGSGGSTGRAVGGDLAIGGNAGVQSAGGVPTLGGSSGVSSIRTGGQMAGIGGSTVGGSGGVTSTGSSYAAGGTGGVSNTSGTSRFPIAQPGLALTDVLPLLTSSGWDLFCANTGCPAAATCANDPDCAWVVSCLVNDCRLAAATTYSDPGQADLDACICMTQTVTKCDSTTDVRSCLGSNCQVSSPAGALFGIDSTSCVTGCTGTRQCPYKNSSH
jgi:hypothetical protein